MFQPRLRAMAMTARRMAVFEASCSERKPPEVFWRSLAIRRSRAASLLVNRVRRSVRKHRHPSFVLLVAERDVVTDAAFLSSAPGGLEGLCFVKGDGDGEDTVPGLGEPGGQ